MSNAGLGTFSLLDFIKNEIREQVLLLCEAIELLRDASSVLSGANKGKQSSEELLKLLKIYPWNLLISLVLHVDEYFQSVQAGMVVAPLHLETLVSVGRNLLSLANIRSSELEQSIHNQKETLYQFDSQIVQFLKPLIEKKSSLEISLPTSLENSQSMSMIPGSFSMQSFDVSMFDLFCTELEIQIQVLNEGLIEVERKPNDQRLIEGLMRAAHSIKGAARVVHLDSLVHLAHAMEDFFVSVQRNKNKITSGKIDQLLRGVDIFARLTKIEGGNVVPWLNEELPAIESLIEEMTSAVFETVIASKEEGTNEASGLEDTSLLEGIVLSQKKSLVEKSVKKLAESEVVQLPSPLEIKQSGDLKKNENKILTSSPSDRERALRVTADNLNQIMGLAGECLVESHTLNSLSAHLHQIKSRWSSIEELLELLSDSLDKKNLSQSTQKYFNELMSQIRFFRSESDQRFASLDEFAWNHAHLADRLYAQAIKCRMRPFSDGVEGFARMVRDLARQLDKQARLEIEGKSTQVDRDILEKLESPLNHLLRNAVDHGIEDPAERKALGKPIEAVIRLQAHYLGGMLAITVSDDGRGVDIESLRKKIIEKNLTTREIAERLSESEIIDFLFLPGFSTSSVLTEISGRGMGLNIVQTMLQEVGGKIRTESILGKGITFHLRLPLTLSVMRALLVEISGEPYAFPLARIGQAFKVHRERVKLIENRQFFEYGEQNIGLISAWEVLDLNEPHLKLQELPVIVLKDHLNSYGLVVDRFIGEKELVVQELNPKLGKIPDISAGALMEDGAPVLIIDTEDLVRSIDDLLSGGRLVKMSYTSQGKQSSNRKRILVVDDSLTVREVECRLLTQHGYEVETAVNGVDGWSAVRINHYDLVITDIDMPWMNGIELVKAIRKDPKLQNLPVLVVSYKEGDEDRNKGLEAGANFYLTKGGFQDTTLIETVRKLVGHA